MRTGTQTDGAMCPVPGGRVWYELRNEHAPGVPVVVVHGGPGIPHDYLRPVADLLPEHPVLVYDQLGSGRSERPADPELWRLPRFVDELEAVLADAGVRRFHLLAHSFGSMVGCDLALRGDVRPDRLMLLSPVLSVRRYEQHMQQLLLRLPPEAGQAIAALLRSGPRRSAAENDALMAFAERHLCRLDPWPDVVLESSIATNAEVRDTLWGPTDFQVTGNLKSYERLDRLSELEMPVLLMCGEHDFTSPRMCQSYEKALPNARLAVIGGASHMAHLEEPSECGSRLREFLGTAVP